MLGDATTRKTGALALVALVLFSTFGAGIAAAAVSSVSIGNTAYTVDEDRTQSVTVDVTADSNGLTGETVTLDVTDGAGTTVASKSKTVDVAASSTKTVTFTVDPAADGLSPGNYSLVALAGASTSSPSDLTVNDVVGPSTAWGQSSYDLFQSGGDSITADYTLNAGDRAQTSNVTIVVIDPSGNETYSTTVQDVSVGAGNSTTKSVTFDSSQVDVTGDHTVQVMWAQAASASTLSVTSPSSPAVNLNDQDYELHNSSDATSVSATLAAGDYDQTGNASLTITDSTGTVVYAADKTDVTVAAGATDTVTFDVTSSDIDATGNYTAEVSWETDSAQTGFEVVSGEGDAIFAGGAGVSGFGGITPILVVISALITIAFGVAALRD